MYTTTKMADEVYRHVIYYNKNSHIYTVKSGVTLFFFNDNCSCYVAYWANQVANSYKKMQGKVLVTRSVTARAL